jgi:hypothetical protein
VTQLKQHSACFRVDGFKSDLATIEGDKNNKIEELEELTIANIQICKPMLP